MNSPRSQFLCMAVLVFFSAVWATGRPSPGARAPQSNWGVRKPLSYDQVRRHFAAPDMIYAPFIFWFWDEPLNPAKMAEMSRVLCSQGFNPGYAHARKSMVGTPDLPADEWLGDGWFEAFVSALGEAEARNGYFGYCDEYWWPSFQANGRVLEANPGLRAQSLRWESLDIMSGSEARVPASFFAVAAELEDSSFVSGSRNETPPELIRSRTLQVIGSGASFAWKPPSAHTWRVYVFHTYHHAGADGGKVNYLDSRLAPAFIAVALEPYAKRMGDRLGRTIPGDFIDNEGDYGWGLAWSETLDKRYKNRYGRDIRLWMPLLIDRDSEGLFARARWEWFDLVSDIYAETFQEVTAWHEARGMYTTAHFWEEGIQPQVNAVGDHLKMLRALTMPGQDCLGRKALRVHDFKEVESVAEFENKRAATELMGAGGFEGTPWGTFNPTFLKQAVNAVTAWGMSHIIPHGVFTTRKLSGNPWPPDWYTESPIFRYLHLWTDFARRASFINSMGHAVPDVLLYNPIESAWFQADARILDIEMWSFDETHPAGKRINEIDRVYAEAIDTLTAARIEFLIGDRHYLKQMQVRKGTLVFGDLVFRAIILPAVDILTLETAGKVLKFAQGGGRVYALAGLPSASAEKGMDDPLMIAQMKELRSQPTFLACGEAGLKPVLDDSAPGLASPVRFLSGGFPLLQHRRRIGGRDFFWLVNNTEEWQECEAVVSGVTGAASAWDCENGEIRPVASRNTDEGSRVSLVFPPLAAYWLVFDPTQPPFDSRPEQRRPETEVVATLEGPWKVTYDPMTQPVMEFPLNPPDEFLRGVEKPLLDWKSWGLEKFSGLLDYSLPIEVPRPGERMWLDLGKVCHAAEVWVNGRSCGARLWAPHVFDVSTALRTGRNEIRIRVANLISISYGEPAESGLLGPVTLRSLRPARGT